MWLFNFRPNLIVIIKLTKLKWVARGVKMKQKEILQFHVYE